METELPKPDAPPSAIYQFSLRAMLGLTALVALFCGLLFAPSPDVRVFAAFAAMLVLPMFWTVVLVYRRGYVRTFALGALFPTGLMLTSLAGVAIFAILQNLTTGEMVAVESASSEADAHMAIAAAYYRNLVGGETALSLACGFLAVAFRWLIEPR